MMEMPWLLGSNPSSTVIVIDNFNNTASRFPDTELVIDDLISEDENKS